MSGLSLIQISAWNDSGGGFLHRLFDGHSQLRVWPFELLLGSDALTPDRFGEDWFKGRFRWPRLGPLAGARGEDIFAAIGDNELRGVLSGAPDSKHRQFDLGFDAHNWRAAFCAAWEKATDQDQASALRLYINTFFQQAERSDADDKPVLGHCPVAILDAPEMWADFQDARIIHVIRDPLTGFADMARRHPDLSAERYALKWSMVNNFAAAMAGKYPHRVRLVAFSNLLHDRANSITGLVDWLGLAYEPGLLVPTWRNRPLDPLNMGPFGGVPIVDVVREVALASNLDQADSAVLTTWTRGTRALLESLDCQV